MSSTDQKIKYIYFIIDLALLNFSILLVLLFKEKSIYNMLSYNEIFVVFNLVWVVSIKYYDTQTRYLYNDILGRIAWQVKITIIYIGIISIILLLLKDATKSRLIIYGVFSIYLLLRIIVGYLFYLIINTARYHGKNLRKILVIGAGRIGSDLYKLFNTNIELGYKIIGFLDDIKESSILKEKIIGELSDLTNILENNLIDEIFLALPIASDKEIQNCIKTADYFGVRVRLIPDFYHVIKRTYKIHNIGRIPVLNVREYPLDDWINYILKRLFDILFSIIILLLISPIMLIVGIKLKVLEKGPVFYNPVRLGRNGKEFKVYKFRSMFENDDIRNGEKSTKKDDPRITSFGKFIRKYNLDELPQFWNVLKGDMSVVGPRPHRIHLNKILQNGIDNYMVRHYVKPGVTGWAQVNGWRGPTVTEEQKTQRTKHDIWYMENWSLIFDIKIILLTLFGKKVHRNVY